MDSKASSVQPRQLRALILTQSLRARVGHIGSSLSIADILSVLVGSVIKGAGTDAPDRDLFILSKGHAALGLYCALHLAGFLSEDQLTTYCGDDSLLGVHPEHQLKGIDFSTGSLGQGLSVGAGCALGAKLQGSGSRTYVLMSDAEMNEGAVWEAAMFSAQYKLDNLTAIVDKNGQQALGRTRDVIDLDPLDERWVAFGWAVVKADGHDLASVRAALSTVVSGVPLLVIASTVSGRGVSFMEGQVAWHYLPLTDLQYEQAMKEINR